MTKRMKMNAVLLGALGLCVLFVSTPWMISCGMEGDIIGGTTAWPLSGTKWWNKVDLDQEIDGAQPFIFLSGEGEEFLEPSFLKAYGSFWVFFERREYEIDENGRRTPVSSEILMGRSSDAFTWELYNDGRPVLEAGLAWEDGFVGAPTVLATEGGFTMWYAGGIGEGIGVAVSENATDWTKVSSEPVVVGDQNWEGGHVGAPSVVYHNHLFRMYYSGGRTDQTPFAQFAGYLIGYADSSDGMSWTKRDTERNSSAAGDDVNFIFSPSQEWEGINTEEGITGAVASPSILITHPADRDVVLMYYSGNFAGDPALHNMSVGIAGSYDYNSFIKGDYETNPALNEKFVLSLDGIAKYMAYSEYTPSVIQLAWNQYIMLYAQSDPLSELTGGLQGIALATCHMFD
jgi:hypothetical protein